MVLPNNILNLLLQLKTIPHYLTNPPSQADHAVESYEEGHIYPKENLSNNHLRIRFKAESYYFMTINIISNLLLIKYYMNHTLITLIILIILLQKKIS